MAERKRDAAFDLDDAVSVPMAWRLGLWALLAVAAIGAAALAARTDIGSERLAAKAPESRRGAAPAGASLAARPFDAEIEARRLNEAVRLLAADRDRLLARISALERNLDDVTGSIPSGPNASHPAASPFPPAVAATPSPAAAPPPASAPATTVVPRQPAPNPAQGQTSTTKGAPNAAAADPGPAASIATKTDFGIDLGAASSVDALRALWMSVKDRHDVLLEGLRPVLAVREGAKGGIELHLVAGPLANAGAAARLCAALAAAGLVCQPAVFDGQRLALR